MLRELEWELAITEEKKNRETEGKCKEKINSTGKEVKREKIQRENFDELQKAETKLEENILILQKTKEVEKEDTNSRSILD